MTKKIRLYQPFGDLGCQRPGMPEICPVSELLGQISDIPMGC